MRVGARHDVPFHVDRSDRQIDTCILRTSDTRYVEVGSGIFRVDVLSAALQVRLSEARAIPPAPLSTVGRVETVHGGEPDT